ncbi:MAG: EF-P beta-lysylation protein EpmB [Sulfurifustis sp.]
MIPGTLPLRQPASWQQELARAVTDPAELVRLLRLDPALVEPARRVARAFPLRVPRGYVARMRPEDPTDPLLRQVLPLEAEELQVPGFMRDPVGDRAFAIGPGLLQKYEGRVLLTTTGACAIHCRYCFRRHFPYADENPASDGWARTLAQLAADESVSEVILSGGDPLTLSDPRLATLVDALAGIGHLKRLRVHTRLPIVLPTRITEELCRLLMGTRLAAVVVVHANHPNEIDAQVDAALARLQDAGAILLNQSVLLRGVNDDAAVLTALSERLVGAGVVPYYLHLLDRVEGAAHFDVDAQIATRICEELSRRLPGYLVPRLVREEPGAPAKTVIR